LPALKPGGLLIYATCSYSQEEDEAIAAWLTSELKMKNEALKTESGWGVIASVMGYRFYPYLLQGEGFFIACFRKEEGNKEFYRKIKPAGETVTKNETAILGNWLKDAAAFSFFKTNDNYFAVPAHLKEAYTLISQSLRIVHAGVSLGKIFKNKLQPGHCLALSNARAASLPALELDYDTAIQYLRKQDIGSAPGHSGWTLATYQQQSLGWLNVLPNRSNNYYPKELRILKQ
jgi:NOL1/NOP2/fmu family ribosome biogenesis protein